MISLVLALADGPASSAAGGPLGAGGSLNTFALMAVMFAIFYFLVIRPQGAKQKEHQNWLRSLKKGDEVVTNGGLWGKISGLSDNDQYITLELQEKVRVKVLRSALASKAPPARDPAATQGNDSK